MTCSSSMQALSSQDHKLKKKLCPSTADHIQTIKVKLFFIAAFLVILSSVVLTRFTQNYADQLNYYPKLVAYPHCILTGKGQCSMATIGDEITAAATTFYDIIVYLLVGGLTWANLIFPLKPSDFRKIGHKLCCFCSKYTSHPQTQPERV